VNEEKSKEFFIFYDILGTNVFKNLLVLKKKRAEKKLSKLLS